ncbi:hypothetical protein SLEP1_g12737 [Rubroshorea leprosula]|uniref:Uncharacterized protein n=1 Tax=Rubroshorea leprosula TaxID=152421 RepID=A0AAV5IP34_9ROSI|nr:hypothetical protein SLEP1_g12737 [Rubroshorea leprosula]
MAGYIPKVPNLRSFTVSASSNGALPGSSKQSGSPVILMLPLIR